MSPIVYLNGDYVPVEQAKISVLDRGFLFGDGVYEVLPFYKGMPVCLTEHMERLQRSLDAININLIVDSGTWKEVIRKLIEKNKLDQQNVQIYLQITRGVMPNRSHHYSQEMIPTIFIMIKPWETLPTESLKKGFSAIVLPDMRWGLCSIKSINLLPNILASQLAKEAGALDAILVRDSKVIEAASSNLFMVINNQIKTPPLQPYMLGGITRDLIIRLAKEANLPILVETCTLKELHAADEIWITGSTKEIAPIISLDKKKVGTGKPGPYWQQIWNAFSKYKENLIKHVTPL